MHSCPPTTQWSNPTIAPYRIAFPQDLKRYSWYGAQFHNGRLVPGSQESANRRCRNVLTTGNPEVVSGSFVPASCSRPEHGIFKRLDTNTELTPNEGVSHCTERRHASTVRRIRRWSRPG